MVRGHADAEAVRVSARAFPRSNLVRDEKGSKATVAKVARSSRRRPGAFALPLDIRGTDLQQRVWREVRKIPFGETSTYSRIAEAIGAPKAIRAVAGACSRSWFAFAVPCHRVPRRGDRREGRQYDWVGIRVEARPRPQALELTA